MEIRVQGLSYVAPAGAGAACRDRCSRSVCKGTRGRRVTVSQETLLVDMSFTIRSGRMTTIIGPSGSGKTTLLRILAGQLSPTTGAASITASGVEIHSTVAIAFVGMKDVHHESLTPYETVEFSVRFANKDISQTDVHRLTVTKLEALDLKSCADKALSLLSDGERMRLRVATALATEPRLLVLDNVLSCLNTAEQVRMMELVKAISSHGYTVIMGINQLPEEIEQQIEDVVLLARGRVLYAGPRDQCQEYFHRNISLGRVANPRTFLDSVVSNLVVSTRSELTTIEASLEETGNSDEPSSSIGLDGGPPVLRLTEATDDIKSERVTEWKTTELAARWRTHFQQTQREAMRSSLHATSEQDALVERSLLDASLKRPGVVAQLFMLLQRFWRASTRDRSDLGNMLAGLLCCAIFVRILGGPEQQRDPLQATIQIAAFVFATLFISVILPHAKVGDWLEFRNLYQLEQSHDEYSPTVYFFSHSLYSLFEMTLMCGLFTIIASGVFLPSTSVVSVFHFFIFLTAHACAHSALLESIVFLVGQNGLSHILGMIIACYSFLFAGFVVPRSQMPAGLGFMYATSYTQYAFTGIMDMAVPHHDITDQIYGYPHRQPLNGIMLSVFIAVLCRIGFVFVLAWTGYKRQLRVKRN